MRTSKLIAIFLAVFALTAMAAPPAKTTTQSKTTTTAKTTTPAKTTTQATTQEAKKPASIDNWISGEVGLFAIGARYERMLSSEFSIGVEAYWHSLIFIWNDGGIIASGRYYVSPIFFGELGIGYNYHTGIGEYEYKSANLFGYGGGTYKTTDWISTSGFVISPGLGWKVDAGDPGEFFVQPGIKLPITIGTQRPVAFDIIGLNTYEEKVGVSIGLVIYCGLGYAF